MAYSSCSFTSSMFLILLFSVICFSTSHHAAAAASTPPSPSYPSADAYIIQIEETCTRNVTYYDLCVTSLESDPESFTGSWAKLPLISLQLSLKNITDTKDYIKNHLRARWSPSPSQSDGLELSVGIASASFPVDNFVERPQCGCGLNCNHVQVRKSMRNTFLDSS